MRIRVRTQTDPFLADAAPRSLYLSVAGLELHALEWGAPGARPVMMWHGLARNCRDFDPLARALSSEYRVIAVDQIGRGLSQWSPDPDTDYCLARYAGIAAAIADALGLGRFHWLGTSMGGALGICAASSALKGRIASLLVNDIGPTLPAPAKERIRTYVGAPPAFASMSALEAYLREAYRPFGHHSDAQWRHLAETSMRRLADGRVTTHYDPKIIRQFDVHPADYEQWPAYDALDLPVMVLHGIESDLLLPEIAAEMARRGPRAEIVEIQGAGHAPGLNTREQAAIVREFLNRTSL